MTGVCRVFVLLEIDADVTTVSKADVKNDCQAKFCWHVK